MATQNYTGILSTVANDYAATFAGYTHTFMSYGKEIFAVLLAINITWIALWYAFDKDSLAGGMSGFLKKFTVATIFYVIMINPSYMGSLIQSATQMGLSVTGQSQLDPSYIITIGANVSLKALDSITSLSFMFNAASILVTLGASFLILFCFVSVALQVAVTQVVATALAMFSCFTLGFSGLGATAGMARKSIDALICACFKLLGYYVVIGASMSVFGQWNKITPGFFHDTRQVYWLCTATLMFWLLSKTMAGVFERVGGGLVGETAGVDFAALAISAAKMAVMGSAKEPAPALDRPKVPPGGNSPNFDNPKGAGGASASAAVMGSGQSSSSTDAVAKGGWHTGSASKTSSNPGANTKSSNDSNHTDKNNAASGAGRKNVINFKEKAAEKAENDSKRTYPGMGLDKKQYKTG